MKGLTVLASVFALGTTLYFAPTSDACTKPRDGAGEPTVDPRDPTGTPPPEGTSGEPDPGGEGDEDTPTTEGGGDDPSAEGGDGEGGSGEPDPGSEGTPPTFTPDPGSDSGADGEVVPPTAFLVIGWQPGYDADSDPGAGYFRHDGHRIETRVLIRDRGTGLVVVDERVPQYDYENASRRDPGPTFNQFATRLPPGTYEAKVQSVFFRHDEVRFGMEGRWSELEKADMAPAIDDSVKGVSFIVSELEASASDGDAAGGCSATSTNGGLAPSLALMALLALGIVRRRRAI